MIRYVGRGSGMSVPDPTCDLPLLDAWVRDAVGVLDAVGSQRCAVYGNGLGGPVAIRFAAAHRDRVDRLVLANTACDETGTGPSDVFAGQRGGGDGT
ncbi:MAG: alpha/beta fold hydrolase [Acidimicrobiia bacterium]